MRVTVYGGASHKVDKEFITQGEYFGKELVSRGHSLVYGGGAHGLMGAVARGVSENKGYILGIAPTFFKSVDGELFKNCNEFIFTESMRERKYLLEENADAFVILPGGAGTFEEFFEALTLKQLNLHNKPIVIYNIEGYYNTMEKLLMEAIDKNFIRPSNVELFTILNSSQEVLDYIENYKSDDQTKNHRYV